MMTLRLASWLGAEVRAQSQFGRIRWAMLRPASWTKRRLFIGSRFQVPGFRGLDSRVRWKSPKAFGQSFEHFADFSCQPDSEVQLRSWHVLQTFDDQQMGLKLQYGTLCDRDVPHIIAQVISTVPSAIFAGIETAAR